MQTPVETRYARSGEVHIAYQTVGSGSVDLILLPGAFSHVEHQWEEPSFARFLRRLASFSRLIVLDVRGTGLSDRAAELPTLEEQIDDVLAVLDAVGSERAALFGLSQGGGLAAPFAAAHPDRTPRSFSSAPTRGSCGPTTIRGDGLRRNTKRSCESPTKDGAAEYSCRWSLQRCPTTSRSKNCGGLGSKGFREARERSSPSSGRIRKRTCDTCYRRSGFPRLFFSVGTMRTVTRTTGAISPRTSPEPSMSSCQAATTCPTSATRMPSLMRWRSS
jgi:alpha/beta hydrolase fold